MGILDNKTRLFDTIVTQEGKRQIASGQLQVKFISLSDNAAFYEADILSGSTDAADRIYFEANDASFDNVTLETDDSGRLITSGSSVVTLLGGKIISGSTKIAQTEMLSGSIFASMAGLILSSSLNNFKNLRVIGTTDQYKDDDEFSLSQDSHTFSITNTSPLGKYDIKNMTVDDSEGIFQDKRLSHIPNFAYLPPVNRPIGEGSAPTSLGDFPRLTQTGQLTHGDLLWQMNEKPNVEVLFSERSRENNLMIQMFEQSFSSFNKLDIIDFGQSFSVGGHSTARRVFFVGKLFKDGLGVDTFINMFTLVFENDFS